MGDRPPEQRIEFRRSYPAQARRLAEGSVNVSERILAFVKDTHDGDAEIRAGIEHDVALERKAQQVFRQLRPYATEQRLVRKFSQTAMQRVDVDARLLLAPAFERVIGDIVQVGQRFP